MACQIPSSSHRPASSAGASPSPTASAPPAAIRGPASEDQLRALIGALFFALSLYYVVSTIVRMVKESRG